MNNKGMWIAGLIALVLVIVFLARRTNDHQTEAPGPPLLPKPSREPGVKEESLQCPACQGFGYVMAPRPGGGTRKRICQFCGGKGGKVLRIPPGSVKCPDCEGFGKQETRDVGSAICPRCNGRGYIEAPFQPTT